MEDAIKDTAKNTIKDATTELLNPGDTTIYHGVEYVAHTRDDECPEYKCSACAFNNHVYGCLKIVCDVNDVAIVFKEKPQELIW